MLLALIAFLGGALTIISPCILPVLPFVFARPGRSFARGTLPMLARHGRDVCGHRDARGRRWRVGGATELVWARCGIGAACGFRCRAHLDTVADLDRATVRGAWQSPGGEHRRHGADRTVDRSRNRHRLAVGAVRRSDPRSDPDGSGDQRAQHRDDAAAVRLRAGRDCFAGVGDHCWRAVFRASSNRWARPSGFAARLGSRFLLASPQSRWDGTRGCSPSCRLRARIESSSR